MEGTGLNNVDPAKIPQKAAEPESDRPANFAASLEQKFRSPAQQQLRAEREWSGAIAALKHLLQYSLESKYSLEASPASGERAGTGTKTAKSPRAAKSMKRSKSAARSSGTIAPSTKGLILSGPFPILDQPSLLANFSAWTFTIGTPGEMPLQLLPSPHGAGAVTNVPIPTLPLLSSDPLAAEQFCLALTANFGVVLVLGETPQGEPAFLFSFDPSVVQQAWRSLQARLRITAPYALPALDGLVEQFVPRAPDFRIVSQFSRLMLDALPHPSDLEDRSQAVNQALRGEFLQGAAQSIGHTELPEIDPTQHLYQAVHPNGQSQRSPEMRSPAEPGSDTELLQAIAHEVRTPLTTIRTLTRLLLRRKDLNPDVTKRLEVIDRECTEQIDRFNLIFRAVELETTQGKNSLASLAPISLAQVLQQTIPRWQQQARQHSHTLEVDLPQKLPMVVTDPTMLDQVLTGLVDRFTHSLPPGSHIQMQVSQAGHQLKLQFESHPQVNEPSEKSKFGFSPALKSLGQLLVFQPETGNLSLNMAVTKNLFQALGGKLIVKQSPHQGEVLTIFLPLENRQIDES
ncbi:MAG: HAMP domain-containing histidine kinase [Oscillatoriophycideae cyanobacterium NC_groundwater_1537_Pr4_S-0.65um_50_18]|nr:HAMP domain-containing histidine kinase [Oscillatoriophycideae cyanobacterium NC_groundwater_1537_Pr4_S-0.65um_50_18]